MADPYPCSGPLRCASVLKVGPAALLLTHLPGRRHTDGQGRVWTRDLDADLAALTHWGAQAVICLVEPDELTAMGVPGYAQAVHARGLALFHLPIRDMSTPGPDFEAALAPHAADLSARLAGPSRIVVHCAAGLGRTGLFCAQLLVRAGCSPQEAIGQVRAVRPGAIETRAQESYIAQLSP